MKKSLFLIRGLPSSGKSTLANLLSENGTYPVLSADMYFEDEFDNYNFDRTKLKDAHNFCQELAEEWMFYQTTPFKIFVANTFTTESEMQPYFDLAKKYDYDVFTIIVENRHGNKNTHNVPDETITKMINRFNIKL